MDDAEDGMSDRLMAGVGSLTGLRQITLTGSDVTDAGLKCLAKLPNLTKLEIASIQTNGSCFKGMSTLRHLNDLTISGDSIKLENVKFLAMLPELQSLQFDRACVNNAEVAYIGQCKELRSLDISLNPAVTDDSAKSLANLKHLETLNISGTSISLKGLTGLKGLPLKWIGLPKADYNRLEAEEIKRLFPTAQIKCLPNIDRRFDPKDADKLLAPLH